MSIEAMKQAIEAFDSLGRHGGSCWIVDAEKITDAITSLRQAIAAAEKQEALQKLHDENERLGLYQDVYEQKPVGQLQEEVYGRGQVMWFEKPANQAMLYTSPLQRQWVGLTDDEVHALWMIGEANISEAAHSVIAYEVETKLKEKNT